MKQAFDWRDNTGREIQEFIAEQAHNAVFWLRLIFLAIVLGATGIIVLLVWAELSVLRPLGN